MPKTFTVECQKRAENSKPNALRRGGLIPAVLYGHSGTESISLTLNAKAAEFLVRDVVVGRSEIEVNIPELSWTGKAHLQEVQAHPAKGHIYHLSFFAITA
jgi:large subunit ribosomal protein L25